MEVGVGYNGMSGIMMNHSRKEIIVASVDWCAQVLAYDYKGHVIREFPNINSYFKKHGLCLDLNNNWEWNVDFGRDRVTGDYLFHFSTSNRESSPQPKEGGIFRLNLERDEILE